MNSRERVIKALNHEEPDRVPIDFGGILASINIYSYEDLLELVGIPSGGGDEIISREWSNVPRPSEKLLKLWGVDFRRVHLGGPDQFEPIIDVEEQTFIDEWGLTWKRFGRYNEFVNPPLRGKEVKDVLAYTFPDPTDPGRFRGVEAEARRLYDETGYAVVAGHSMFGCFELGCWLCGFDYFMEQMVMNKNFVLTFFERVLEVQKEIFGRYLDLVGPYVQMIETADDLGTQRSSMISPRMYRELIKPFHKEYLQFIKSKVPHAKIFMHSCGAIFDLIPDLIDNGVDILNPIQPTAKNMEAWRLKDTFGDQLTFHGGIDVVDVLPKQRPDEVAAYVKTKMEIMGQGGGYILAASHNVQDDTPVENVVAMYRAGQKFGKYPLRKVN
jgi:uroporphyrinogen decarboxylase